MRATVIASTIALALAAPASAATAPLSDFRLPGDSTPTPQPQGPVVEDAPPPRAVEPEPTPSPTPSVIATPPAAAPFIVPETIPPPEPTPTPTSRAAPRPSPTPRTRAAEPAPVPADNAAPSRDVEQVEAGPTPPPPAPPEPEPAFQAAPQSEMSWLVAVLALAVALLAGLGFWWWRRRSDNTAEPQAIEKPQPPSPAPRSPASPSPASPAAAAGPTLDVALEPVRLSLSLMNATLSYRLVLANRSDAPLSDVVISADMIGAHASLSSAQQLSGPADGAPVAERLNRLEAGERCVIAGDFRLPRADIVPIRRGESALLVPLARFRVEANGMAPLLRTFLVGLPPPRANAGLLPIRLDLGPRVYSELAQRAFA